jgi:hypothetical protein
MGKPSLCIKVMYMAFINHEGNLGLISNSWEQSKNLLSFFLQQPAKQFLFLVSQTPPSGCQAQGVNVSKSRYDMQYGKVNNNAIK